MVLAPEPAGTHWIYKVLWNFDLLDISACYHFLLIHSGYIRGTWVRALHYPTMNDDDVSKRTRSAPVSMETGDTHWIEIFAGRIAEDLKQILQEDMDWMTSHPILERLNRLQEAEEARRQDADLQPEFRKAS